MKEGEKVENVSLKANSFFIEKKTLAPRGEGRKLPLSSLCRVIVPNSKDLQVPCLGSS